MYLNLGAVSLAFAAFARLNIKHVQNDTLSHYALTRISTVHPWPVTGVLPPQGNKSDYDADAMLARALHVYEKAPEQVFRMAKVAIDHGSYSQIPGFIDLEGRLGTSICKYMWDLERRRVMRWRNSKTAAAAAAKVTSSMFPGRANKCPFCWKDTSLK
jgi:N-terminal acetyltransferase B complex non-catalytic subunit